MNESHGGIYLNGTADMQKQIFDMTFNKAEIEDEEDETCILRPDGAMY